jgi:hypothetical protein
LGHRWLCGVSKGVQQGELEISQWSTMGPYLYTSPKVKQILTNWFKESNELFVDISLPHSGSSGDFYVLKNFEQYTNLIDKVSPGSICTILREKQLPLRGIVTYEFIKQAIELIPDGTWYRICPPCVYPDKLEYFGCGNTHDELRTELEECLGIEVWVGKDLKLPEYWKENTHPDLLVVTKPNE